MKERKIWNRHQLQSTATHGLVALIFRMQENGRPNTNNLMMTISIKQPKQHKLVL